MTIRLFTAPVNTAFPTDRTSTGLPVTLSDTGVTQWAPIGEAEFLTAVTVPRSMEEVECPHRRVRVLRDDGDELLWRCRECGDTGTYPIGKDTMTS